MLVVAAKLFYTSIADRCEMEKNITYIVHPLNLTFFHGFTDDFSDIDNENDTCDVCHKDNIYKRNITHYSGFQIEQLDIF